MNNINNCIGQSIRTKIRLGNIIRRTVPNDKANILNKLFRGIKGLAEIKDSVTYE